MLVCPGNGPGVKLVPFFKISKVKTRHNCVNLYQNQNESFGVEDKLEQ